MNTALLSLLQLSDPALPIGGYAHSWGLETYVQEGVVYDTVTAEEYVRQMLSTSLHYTDAALMVLSYLADAERGKRNIGLVNVVRIAAALGVSLDRFFREVEVQLSVK